ncbi:hypothetical protein WJM97_01535 [Okeanomitos corallinicola TIOX110]|uniref:TonB C-terminal domain-containing protein n=1 Tax=Okeanomitos corallinicola TIOX110 TaxID=3133117 RepID=A0ABZ2UTG5_9CYAN
MNSINPSLNLQDKNTKYKHTDPPWLWIFVLISSMSLHLLAVLFLLPSLDKFKHWIPQPSQDAISIEFIEISPKEEANSTPKLEPKPQLTAQRNEPKSVTSSLPKTTQSTEKIIDNPVINSDLDFSNQSKNENISVSNQPVKTKPKPTPQPTVIPETKPEIKIPPIPIPTPQQTIPLNDLPWNRRQEIKLGEGTALPGNLTSDSPIPTPENSPIPIPENSPIPIPENSPIPTPEVTPTVKGVGIRVNINPIEKDEVEKLRQDNKIRVDALPDVFAEYQGSSTKEIELDIVLGEYGLKPANVMASLIIDQNGNCQKAEIITIEPVTVVGEKDIYEQALNEVFKNENFVPAYNLDGSKPGLSNLYMRIRIDIINNSERRLVD